LSLYHISSVQYHSVRKRAAPPKRLAHSRSMTEIFLTSQTAGLFYQHLCGSHILEPHLRNWRLYFKKCLLILKITSIFVSSSCNLERPICPLHKLFCVVLLLNVSRYSSVGIATGYGLYDRMIRVRFPAGAGNFSLRHRVQTGSGPHPASYPLGAGGFFLGGKAAGARSWPLTSI
jgi:hypothetical protein